MGKKKSGGPLRSVGLKLPWKLWEAFENLASRNYRTLTAELTLALEKHLSLEGLWPPKGDRNGVGESSRSKK